jgi:DNA-binding GntR family transcriptional regulator
MQNGAAFETLSRQVYTKLRGRILEGRLQPGARLSRRAIAKELGVSPIPVIEALLRLEQDGLVQSEPMYGARVKLITLEGCRNDQVLREAIECQTARLCAENATDGQLAQLAALAPPLDEAMASGDPRHRFGMDRHLEFHTSVARFTGYPLLERELNRVWFQQIMWVNWVNAAVFPVPENWHQRLVDALASRDVREAEGAMREHVRYGVEYYEEALRQLSDSAARGMRADGNP